jgi:Ser/Thr protein kinase RdoA (MazF antagonist)
VIPPELDAVLRLLPAPASEVRQLGGPGRPWSVRYGSNRAVLRWNDPERYRRFGYSTELALASIDWLHTFLGDLAAGGYLAPRPVADFDGQSRTIVGGAIWELLSHVPGGPMGWTDDEMREAGAQLARFHDASLGVAARSQRPGSMPLAECRPSDPQAGAVREEFERGLLEFGSMPRGVIHGDATQANVVIGDDGAFHLVDFALAYQEVLYADIGSALWRNGRSSPEALTYDAGRVTRFVRGYHAVRPLDPATARGIVSCMIGRGLQLQQRLELRGGTDDTVMERLLAIHGARAELTAGIEAAVERMA